MIIEVLLCVAASFLIGAVAFLFHEADKVRDMLINVAMKVTDLEDRVDQVDDSTGIAIHELGLKIETFNKLYGEAVIEETREAARAEKAWADGVNNIMSFGTALHGRGDST